MRLESSAPVAAALSLVGFNLAVLVYFCRVVPIRTARGFFPRSYGVPSTPNPNPNPQTLNPLSPARPGQAKRNAASEGPAGKAPKQEP